MSGDVLDRFSPATAAWFRGSFSAPTTAQEGAWEAISSGHHALVVAPTGSGKTLSAFLWALDRLASQPLPDDKKARCRVLYVSPMKALAVDVERNLRSPLVGIRHAAARLGVPEPDITVAVRSGDTPADERRAFARTPTDVLITTPESLFLILTSAAREALAGVETVIIDEVHALAGTKRGAHLALSLERLDAHLERPAQRIGLSATVRPVEEVARYLAGGRPVDVVQPPSTKQWDLKVVVPVPDMAELGQPTGDLSGAAAGQEQRASIWPHVEERIVDLVAEHTSTLVFSNCRRLAERLTTRLNEIWEERVEAADGADTVQAADAVPRAAVLTRSPAQVMAQSGAARGAPAVLARAHHGSVSKEQRATIEEDLKSGRLPAVVATSSLELGIDMGAVDLVVQVESPPSVASGLQRVGRAGHQVGAVVAGCCSPSSAATSCRPPSSSSGCGPDRSRRCTCPTPRSTCSPSRWSPCAPSTSGPSTTCSRWSAVRPPTPRSPGRCSSRCSTCWPGATRATSSPSCAPRIVWDRLSDTLTGRRGAQRLAVTCGGTIPDRGLYGVFLATGEGPGRRVGELDEEMVYESRVGDVFTLGTSTWRIEDITHDRVLVTPAPGLPGRLPFWKGDSLGRPAELGRAVGAFVREVEALTPEAARARVMAAGLDDWAADNLLGYLREQREATGHVPDDRTIVVERFRDELGDWRVVIHSPFGAQVHAPWALAVSARMRERFGVDVQAMHGDDGIVLRLPDLELDEVDGVRERGVGRELLDLVTLDPDDVRALVTDEIGGSALFAARFRECAARALLLPRRRPDRRQPLWQQRQRASQLLEVASQYPTFPIVLETVRECVQDVFDVPGLVDLMRDIGSRRVTVVEVESSTPSPFAKSLLFGYVAQFLYEGDSPLAERRAAALALDPSLLAELLGRSEGLALRDLLDAEQIARTEAELQRLTPERAARDADDVLDLLRSLGPLPVDGILARCREGTTGDDVEQWLAGLDDQRQVIAGPGRRGGPVVGHRRRRPAARRPRRLAASRCARGLPRAGRRPARRPRGPLRPHARPVPRRRGGPGLRAGLGRRRRPPCARLVVVGPGRRGRAAADRRRWHRVLRRRGAADAAPPLARGPAGRGRAGHPGRAVPLPAAVAGRRRPAARARRPGAGHRAAQRGRAPGQRRWRPSCCPPGSPTTPPPCSTS